MQVNFFKLLRYYKLPGGPLCHVGLLSNELADSPRPEEHSNLSRRRIFLPIFLVSRVTGTCPHFGAIVTAFFFL